jgi:putative ABC transport system permease protein
MKYRNRKDITIDQATAVKEKVTNVKYVDFSSTEFGKIAKHGDVTTNPNVFLIGASQDYIPSNNYNVVDGRSIAELDINYRRSVCVLGSELAKKLFPFDYPIGQYVRVDGQKYEVIGVLEELGSRFGQSQDNVVVVPITTFLDGYGEQHRSLVISITAASREVYDAVVEQVTYIMRVARKVPPGKEDDFEIYSNDSVIKQFNDFTSSFKIGAGAIAGIALLAAGIGIMNIMLVSVTERTREIGIRKAVGARKRNILAQFVMEAIVLSEIGGLFGILLGILGGNIAALAFDIPPVFPIDWAIIGALICSIVGITFGVYPAWKAANLDPIESLRYE